MEIALKTGILVLHVFKTKDLQIMETVLNVLTGKAQRMDLVLLVKTAIATNVAIMYHNVSHVILVIELHKMDV